MPTGRDAIEAAAPVHVAAVRALAFDGLDAGQLRAPIEVTSAVLARPDEPVP